jgi:lipopolysaccharide biosynthesis regulator YciM
MEVLKGEAVALICGQSWVYQREGRLDLARVLAQDSLDLGKKIPWARNTAFCKKCLGRLYRLEAKESSDTHRREELYALSVSFLQEAIDCFESLEEIEDEARYAEIGDCYSLLARTYLESGNRSKADAFARQALPLLKDKGDKDYLDFQIVLGDISARNREWETASSFYTVVIDQQFEDDPEKTEMRARALHRRGLSWQNRQQTERALKDFRQAAAIWLELRDPRSAALAEWEIYRIENQLPQELVEELRKEKPLVRVIVAKIYQEQSAGASAAVIARRATPTRQEIEQLKEAAARRIAREVPERV